MASTINLLLDVSMLMNERMRRIGKGIFAPYTIATSSDIFSADEINLPATTATTLATFSTAPKLAVFISSVATTYVWATAGGDQDNNSAVVPAGLPFILYTQAVPYQNTSSNRVDETAANITSVVGYSSSLGKVATFIAA